MLSKISLQASNLLIQGKPREALLLLKKAVSIYNACKEFDEKMPSRFSDKDKTESKNCGTSQIPDKTEMKLCGTSELPSILDNLILTCSESKKEILPDLIECNSGKNINEILEPEVIEIPKRFEKLITLKDKKNKKRKE